MKTLFKVVARVAVTAPVYAYGVAQEINTRIESADNKVINALTTGTFKEYVGDIKTTGSEHTSIAAEYASDGINTMVDAVSSMWSDDEPKVKPANGYGSFGKRS